MSIVVSRQVIDRIFDEWEFEHEVKDSDGWSSTVLPPNQQVSTRNVFLEVDPEEPSQLGVFKVEVTETPLGKQPLLCASFNFVTRTIRYYDLEGNPIKPHFTDEETDGPLYLAVAVGYDPPAGRTYTYTHNFRSHERPEPQAVFEELDKADGHHVVFERILLIQDGEVVSNWGLDEDYFERPDA